MLATHNNEKKRKKEKKKTAVNQNNGVEKKAQKSGASIGVVEKMIFHHSENKDWEWECG